MIRAPKGVKIYESLSDKSDPLALRTAFGEGGSDKLVCSSWNR